MENETTPPLVLGPPGSAAEWAAYYALRYEVLRAPWGQPPGSERADDDDTAFHLLARTPAGAVVGVGRLHTTSATEGQIRFMAVAPAWQRRGVGERLVAALEAEARRQGLTQLVLEARETAVAFYQRLGYQTVAPAHTLFGRIPHWRMAKPLT